MTSSAPDAAAAKLPLASSGLRSKLEAIKAAKAAAKAAADVAPMPRVSLSGSAGLVSMVQGDETSSVGGVHPRSGNGEARHVAFEARGSGERIVPFCPAQ